MDIYAKVLLDGAASATLNWIGAGTLATYGGLANCKIKLVKWNMSFSQCAVANTYEIIETHVVSAASATNSTFKVGAPATSGSFCFDFSPSGIPPATQTATAVGYKLTQSGAGTVTAWFVGTTG